jgi:hypothetical protein
MCLIKDGPFPPIRLFSHTAIGFYVKIMSAHGSHLGWRSWSPDTIFKVYYPRTIHAMFALNLLTGFRGEDFQTIFP